MKLAMLFILACLIGCSSPNTTATSLTAPNDAGVDSAPIELPQVNDYDAGVVDDWYVSQKVVPTKYGNLFEHDCVGSDGTVSIKDYYDSSLNIYCNWNTATDMSVRCLPNNWESSFSYADDTCAPSAAIGLDQVSTDGGSGTGYLGVETYSDAGTSIEVHTAGDKYVGGNPVYYLLLDRATDKWSCESTYVKLTGIGFFYVGKVIAPIIFTKK